MTVRNRNLSENPVTPQERANKVFSCFPARVTTHKINFGVGVLVQDVMTVMTLVMLDGQ